MPPQSRVLQRNASVTGSYKSAFRARRCLRKLARVLLGKVPLPGHTCGGALSCAVWSLRRAAVPRLHSGRAQSRLALHGVV